MFGYMGGLYGFDGYDGSFIGLHGCLMGLFIYIYIYTLCPGYY